MPAQEMLAQPERMMLRNSSFFFLFVFPSSRISSCLVKILMTIFESVVVVLTLDSGIGQSRSRPLFFGGVKCVSSRKQ